MAEIAVDIDRSHGGEDRTCGHFPRAQDLQDFAKAGPMTSPQLLPRVAPSAAPTGQVPSTADHSYSTAGGLPAPVQQREATAVRNEASDLYIEARATLDALQRRYKRLSAIGDRQGKADIWPLLRAANCAVLGMEMRNG